MSKTVPGRAPIASEVGRTDESGLVHRPSLKGTARLFEGPLGIRSLSLTGLFVLACFYTLYFARDFFLPVMLAIVFMFVLTPLTRMLKKVRVPEALGAAIVIAAVRGCAGFLAFELSGPLTEWLEKAPEIGAKLEAKAQRSTTSTTPSINALPLRSFNSRSVYTTAQMRRFVRVAARTPQGALARVPLRSWLSEHKARLCLN